MNPFRTFCVSSDPSIEITAMKIPSQGCYNQDTGNYGNKDLDTHYKLLRTTGRKHGTATLPIWHFSCWKKPQLQWLHFLKYSPAKNLSRTYSHIVNGHNPAPIDIIVKISSYFCSVLSIPNWCRLFFLHQPYDHKPSVWIATGLTDLGAETTGGARWCTDSAWWVQQ